MIVLDTNVISELMAIEPSPAVRIWLDKQDPGIVWTTAVTLYEINFGIELMPAGRKRAALEGIVFDMLIRPFERRVLPFGEKAANATAALSARRKKAGRPISILDAQIAGIVEANSATLVTRDVGDFWGVNFPVVSPWEAA